MGLSFDFGAKVDCIINSCNYLTLLQIARIFNYPLLW